MTICTFIGALASIIRPARASTSALIRPTLRRNVSFDEDGEVVGKTDAAAALLVQDDLEEVLAARISLIVDVEFVGAVAIEDGDEGWELVHIACVWPDSDLSFAIAVWVHSVGQPVDDVVSVFE